MLVKSVVKPLEYWAIVVRLRRAVSRFYSCIHSEAGTLQQLQSDDATLPHDQRPASLLLYGRAGNHSLFLLTLIYTYS